MLKMSRKHLNLKIHFDWWWQLIWLLYKWIPQRIKCQMAMLSKHTVLHNTQWYLSHTQVFVCVPVLSCPFILRNTSQFKNSSKAVWRLTSSHLSVTEHSLCVLGEERNLSQGCRKPCRKLIHCQPLSSWVGIFIWSHSFRVIEIHLKHQEDIQLEWQNDKKRKKKV